MTLLILMIRPYDTADNRTHSYEVVINWNWLHDEQSS